MAPNPAPFVALCEETRALKTVRLENPGGAQSVAAIAGTFGSERDAVGCTAGSGRVIFASRVPYRSKHRG
jgi:hypothetical protein